MSDTNIYDAVSKIGAEIVKDGGISKDRKNQSQGYAFRGVEDFLNVLAPLLPKHRVVIVPRLVRRDLAERTTAKGGTMFHAIAEYEFDFISAADGSKLTVGPVVGEAMDSGDKAHNKTLSMAYKYAVMIAFCIPTNVDDADADSPAVTGTVNKQTGEITGRATPSTPAPAVPEIHLPPPVHVPSVSGGNGDGDAVRMPSELETMLKANARRVYAPEKRAGAAGLANGFIDEYAGDTDRRHTFLLALFNTDTSKMLTDGQVAGLLAWKDHPSARSEVNRVIADYLKLKGQQELFAETA